MSFTGIGLIAIPISTARASGLSIGNKVINEIIINKNNKYKKQFEKEVQTIKFFDKFYRKSLQDDIIYKLYMKCYVIQPLENYENGTVVFDDMLLSNQ